MKILRPVETAILTQAFGDSRACVKVDAQGRATRPFKVIAKSGESCIAGYKDFYTTVLKMNGHNGTDHATYFKEPCHFPVEAETEWYAKSASDNDGGIGVDVFSKSRISFPELPKEAGAQARSEWKRFDGKMYVKFRFWHLHSYTVSKKEPVVQGQLIGYCDSTGASSGNHLHWSMKFVDEKDRTLDTDNGYQGAVDFSAWYEDGFVLTELERLRAIRETAQRAVEIAKEVVETLPGHPPKEQMIRLGWVERLLRAVLSLIK